MNRHPDTQLDDLADELHHRHPTWGYLRRAVVARRCLRIFGRKPPEPVAAIPIGVDVSHILELAQQAHAIGNELERLARSLEED